MHRFVFENGVGRFGAIEQGMSGLIDRILPQRFLDERIRLTHVREHLDPRRPQVRVYARIRLVDGGRIDAAGK